MVALAEWRAKSDRLLLKRPEVFRTSAVAPFRVVDTMGENLFSCASETQVDLRDPKLSGLDHSFKELR
jgi:hypothetical protein